MMLSILSDWTKFMIKNIYAEFLMTSQETSQETYFLLEKAVRPFYKLNEQHLKEIISNGNCYESNFGSKDNLIIIEGGFFNQYSSNWPLPINKNTTVFLLNNRVLGLFETHTRYDNDNVFYSFNIFIKAMSSEQLRLMLEFTLPKILGSKVMAIRDQIIECISLQPIPRFKRTLLNTSFLD